MMRTLFQSGSAALVLVTLVSCVISGRSSLKPARAHKARSQALLQAKTEYGTGYHDVPGYKGQADFLFLPGNKIWDDNQIFRLSGTLSDNRKKLGVKVSKITNTSQNFPFEILYNGPSDYTVKFKETTLGTIKGQGDNFIVTLKKYPYFKYEAYVWVNKGGDTQFETNFFVFNDPAKLITSDVFVEPFAGAYEGSVGFTTESTEFKSEDAVLSEWSSWSSRCISTENFDDVLFRTKTIAKKAQGHGKTPDPDSLKETKACPVVSPTQWCTETGNTIGTHVIPARNDWSREKCKEECEKRPECHYYEFNLIIGNCYLKKNPTPKRSENVGEQMMLEYMGCPTEEHLIHKVIHGASEKNYDVIQCPEDYYIQFLFGSIGRDEFLLLHNRTSKKWGDSHYRVERTMEWENHIKPTVNTGKPYRFVCDNRDRIFDSWDRSKTNWYCELYYACKPKNKQVPIGRASWK